MDSHADGSLGSDKRAQDASELDKLLGTPEKQTLPDSNGNGVLSNRAHHRNSTSANTESDANVRNGSVASHGDGWVGSGEGGMDKNKESEKATIDEDVEFDVDGADIVQDGGWGWVVCFGAFMISFIIDGTLFSFGILMIELVSDLGQDKSTTSLIGSVQMGIHMVMGPIISGLLQIYTIRQVVLAGTLLSSVAFAMSVFAPNIYMLIFLYGLIGGIGFGMVFLPSLIVVVPYFNKHRAIATGIATSGSGLGMFGYAYIMDQLLQSFNWRGTVLILSALLLHCLVCGLLFRPMQLGKKRTKTQSKGISSCAKPSENSKIITQDKPSMYSIPPNSECNGYYEGTKKSSNDSSTSANGDIRRANGKSHPIHDEIGSYLVNSVSEIQILSLKDRSKKSELFGKKEYPEIESLPDGTKHRCCSDYTILASQNHYSQIKPSDESVVCGGYVVDNGPQEITSNQCRSSVNAVEVPPVPIINCDTIETGLNNNPNSGVGLDGNNACSNVPVILKTPPSPGANHTTGESLQTSSSGKDFKFKNAENNETVSAVTASSHSQKCPKTDSESTTTQNTSESNLNNDNSIMCDSKIKPSNSSSLNTSLHNILNTNKDFVTNDIAIKSDTPSGDFSKPHCPAVDEDRDVQFSPPIQFMHMHKQLEIGNFSRARLSQSADHIHSIRERLTNDTNMNTSNLQDATTTRNRHSNNTINAKEKGSKNQYQASNLLKAPGTGQPFTKLAPGQAVSLYGINGYRSKHPHHGLDHNQPHQHHFHTSKSDVVEQINKGLLNPILRKDIYYSGSVQHLPAYQQFGSMASFLAAMTRRSSTEVVDVITHEPHKKGNNSLCHYLKSAFPLELMKDKMFLLLLLTFVMWTAQTVTMTYLPSYAVSVGIDRSSAASLISIIGVSNVLGRLLAGFLTDCLPFPSTWLYSCALTVGAFVNFFIPLVTNYYMLAVCSSIFGLCMAVSVSMRTIVLADQMGVEVLTQSFGIVALFQGVAFIIIPPIAGGMIDHFQSSRQSFWLAAAMYSISAMSMILVACMGRRTDGVKQLKVDKEDHV